MARHEALELFLPTALPGRPPQVAGHHLAIGQRHAHPQTGLRAQHAGCPYHQIVPAVLLYVLRTEHIDSQVMAVAILVDPVVGNLDCTGMDTGIVVIAVHVRGITVAIGIDRTRRLVVQDGERGTAEQIQRRSAGRQGKHDLYGLLPFMDRIVQDGDCDDRRGLAIGEGQHAGYGLVVLSRRGRTVLRDIADRHRPDHTASTHDGQAHTGHIFVDAVGGHTKPQGTGGGRSQVAHQPVEGHRHVQHAIAEGIVRSGNTEIGRRGDQRCLDLADRGSGEGALEYGHGTADMRDGKRASRYPVVSRRHAVGGQYIGPGCDQARVDAAVACPGTPAALRIDMALIVHAADRDHARIVRRAHAGIPPCAIVATGKHHGDVGRLEQRDIVLEFLVALVDGALQRPGIVDDARGVVGERVTVRIEHPLKGLVNDAQGREIAVVEYLGRDPLRLRRHACLVIIGTIAYQHPHDLGAVPVDICWRSMLAMRIEPAVAPSPVVGSEIGVSDIDTSIQAGHHDPLASVASRPYLLHTRGRQVPVRRCVGRGTCAWPLDGSVVDHPLHAGNGCDAIDQKGRDVQRHTVTHPQGLHRPDIDTVLFQKTLEAAT